ncbi:MAG: flagellar biosynthesis protein FlhB [Hyphomicrobiales bacterium]
MSSERTEAPTPRRREDARKQGNVAKSQELVSVGVLLAAVLALRAIGPGIWHNLTDIVRDGLGHPAGQELTPESTMQLGRDAATHLLLTLAPLFAIVGLAGVALNVAQTGFFFSGVGLKPKLSNINPASGAKRIFSKDGGVNLAKALFKMAVIAAVVYMTMRSQLSSIAELTAESVPQATAHTAQLCFDIALRSALVLFLMGVADWAWQRRQYMSRLRMTKEELRQELKESDGDPQIKAAIRRRRQALLNRMMAAVPKADVVVTNPTHYAVALKYDPVSMQAPMVVAKGENLLALRIREVARKHSVPVLEEPPLARALYAAVPVGQYVPANLFHAVAEVLAWVYAMRERAAGIRRRTQPQGAL